MFIDKVTITVKGGNGGDGSMSFRREKYIPKGGPNGGDGGRGGSVIFRANPRIKTLLDFSRKRRFDAQRGDPGSGNKRYGKDGSDLVLEVPCGTTVYKNGELAADLLVPGEETVIVKGGRGGRGNFHFRNSVRQAPRIAEKGEPAEKVTVTLQLRLIADVGLIGFPNAGKSTLLSRLTRAHPKIAGYPFTTLFPNLGVARVHDQDIIFSDNPGLIEGSHTGRGLGYRFLQHIERTRILVHVVDPLGYEGKTAKDNIKIINDELKRYSRDLAKKPQIIAINKQDLTEGKEIFAALKRSLKRVKALPVSGVSGDGMEGLLKAVYDELQKTPAPQVRKEKEKAVRVRFEPDYWVEKEDDIFVVKGKKVETLVAMTPMNLPDAVERTQVILRKIGVERALHAKGAQPGDPIRIAGVEFRFEPELLPSDRHWKKELYQS